MEQHFSKKVWTATGIIALTAAVLVLLTILFNVLLLVLAGILMAIFFHGCASLLHKYLHLPKNWSVFASVLLNTLLLVGFIWFVGARLESQISTLTDKLPDSISSAKNLVKQYPAGDKLINYLNASGDSGKTLAAVKTFFSSSFGILSDLYIIILIGLFFTASPLTYKRGVIALLPPSAKNTGINILDKLHKVLKNWIKGMLFGFVFIAVLSALGLWAIGLPLILTLALIAGLGNFIPNFGPIISLIPALLLALTIDSTTAIWVVCLYLAIQIIQSAVTQPLIQKKMTSVPPALIIFGQVSMGLLAGFWGVLLATPIVAIIKTIVEELYVKNQKGNLAEQDSDNVE